MLQRNIEGHSRYWASGGQYLTDERYELRVEVMRRLAAALENYRSLQDAEDAR